MSEKQPRSQKAPKNLPELFKQLEETVPPQSLEQLRKLEQDHLIVCHFGFNMYVRNTYLWSGKSPMMDLFCEIVNFPDVDSLSSFITEAFWLHLNGTGLTLSTALELLRAHGLLYEGEWASSDPRKVQSAVRALLDKME